MIFSLFAASVINLKHRLQPPGRNLREHLKTIQPESCNIFKLAIITSSSSGNHPLTLWLTSWRVSSIPLENLKTSFYIFCTLWNVIKQLNILKATIHISSIFSFKLHLLKVISGLFKQFSHIFFLYFYYNIPVMYFLV